MLITFSTDVHPDVVLFGEVATIFLRIMGEKEEPPGILRGEDIKVAMERLQSWLNQMPQRDNNDEENSDDEGRLRRSVQGQSAKHRFTAGARRFRTGSGPVAGPARRGCDAGGAVKPYQRQMTSLCLR